VHEASTPRAWLPHTGVVLRNATKLGEGLGYARTLARHRVPVRSRSVLIAAHGDERLSAVTVGRAGRHGVGDGTERTIECDTLAVGWGFTPQLELPLELGCATRVDTDGSLVCVVDDDQQGSVPGVFIAGEACGVGGAVLALVEGAIAGAAATGVPVRDARLTRQRSALRSFAAAMHTAHPVPPGWITRLTDDTTVCRCEEVTAARLREAVDAGASDARAAKLMARPGMGWCQGRVCGYATACLTAAWSGTPYRPDLVGHRPVAAPFTLGALARTDGAGDR
jgi:NAD(P)H-nitrite reductase large subunit